MDDFITLVEAAELVPGRPSAQAIWRWCRKGVRCKDGSRVRLTHRRVGKILYTRADWLDEFFADQTKADLAFFEADDGSFERPEFERQAVRIAAVARSKKSLKKMGFKIG